MDSLLLGNNEEEEKVVKELAAHYDAILRLLGDDPERDGLKKTPIRAARAMLYATRGHRQTSSAVVNGALFEVGSSGMVVVKNIEFYSLCEHHILPFYGHISIGYMPKGKIIGISKLARLVDMFARRLQVQERLCAEIVDELTEVVGSVDVIARCEAHHLCMMMRGVEKQDSTTVTLCQRGRFEEDPNLRAQFFEAIR